MKKITLTLSLIAAVSTLFVTSCNNEKETGDANTAEAAAGVAASGSVVYFDLDKVMTEYDMANELRSEVETKLNSISSDVERRQKNLESAYNDFANKINKGLMTSAVAQEQQRKLEEQRLAFEQYAQQKQNEGIEEQQVMVNRIIDAIKTFVDSFNKEKAYSMIITNQGGFPIVAADSTLDITKAIIDGLNQEYVKTKNQKAE